MRLIKENSNYICYVKSKKFGPYYLPVRYQYLIQREYLSKINKKFSLPQGEAVFSKTSIRLRSIIDHMKKNDVLVLVSIFMLPENNQIRIKLLNKIIKKKIKIHCIFENIVAKNKLNILNLHKRIVLYNKINNTVD